MNFIPADCREYISNALRDNNEFALFRFPGEKTFHITGKDGYSMSLVEFGDLSKKTIRIIPSNHISDTRTVKPEPTDSVHYLQSVKTLADYHRDHGGKTVLSRVITGIIEIEDIVDIAEQYFDANPNAFCSLINSGALGLWLVATPELLLKADASNFQTMALAGTRQHITDRLKNWDTKNKGEQTIVTEFIINQWKTIGLKPIIDGPHTLRSNSIEHLCTRIEAERIADISANLVLDVTSPTPAVCGFPREISMAFINSLEKHNRGLYGGYVLVECPDGELSAYVVLRCAQLFNDGTFAIYVGGGITGDSIPKQELEETELKARCLGDLLHKANYKNLTYSS